MIAECFNTHFLNITDSLGLDPKFKQVSSCIELNEKLEVALMKYSNHPSIIAIKHKVSYEQKFQFSHVYPWDVMKFVETLDASKSTSGNKPTKIIKMAKYILCPYLTDCINTAIQNCSFPDELKKADVSSIFKQDDSSWKGNYRPISVLSALSKVYEKIIEVILYLQYYLTYCPALGKDTVLNMRYFMLSNPGKNVLIPKALLVLS